MIPIFIYHIQISKKPFHSDYINFIMKMDGKKIIF